MRATDRVAGGPSERATAVRFREQPLERARERCGVALGDDQRGLASEIAGKDLSSPASKDPYRLDRWRKGEGDPDQ